jgi:hypothetical protein
MYKDSDCISLETHYISATETNRLMLCREKVAVYCEIYKGHTNALLTDIGIGTRPEGPN